MGRVKMPKVTRQPRKKAPVNRRVAKSESAATAAPEQRTERERRPRIPFGGFQYKLEIANKDPNYFYYWQKDVGDNIARMQDAGYEFVSERDAKRFAPETLTDLDVSGGNQSLAGRMERFGGRDAQGQEYNLIAMRQRMDWHLEDMALLEERNKQIDATLARGVYDGDPGDSSTRYGEGNFTIKHEE